MAAHPVAAPAVGVTVQTHDGGESLARQSGSLPYARAVAMMSDPQNNSAEFHGDSPNPDGPTAYQLSARNMAFPEQLVLAPRPVLKDRFRDWALNFQYDVFQHVPDGFVFPELRQSDTYYTVRFEDGTGHAYEVAVCPVLDARDWGASGSFVKVHVLPPEMPLAHDDKLRSSHYPVDQVNVEIMRQLFGAFEVKQSTASSLPGWRAELARETPPAEDAVKMPSEWRFVFRSRFGSERECGSHVMPQVLGRLWFLRDALAGPVDYTLVQLNQLAYVGMIHDVAGFNVFLQVNCSMPSTRVQHYFAAFPPRCPQAARQGRRTSALGVGVVTVPAGTSLGRALPVLQDASSRIHATKEGLQTQFDNEIKGRVSTARSDLFKRVLTHAIGRDNAYSAMVRNTRSQELVQAVRRVFGAGARALSDAPGQGGRTGSILQQTRLLEAAFQTKFSFMVAVLASLPPDTVVEAIEGMSQYDAVVGAIDLDAVAKVLALVPAERASGNVVATFVPAVCATAAELLALVGAFPERLPPDDIEAWFGVVGRDGEDRAKSVVDAMVSRRNAWVRNHDMPYVDVADKNTLDISMSDFATWYTMQFLRQSDDGSELAGSGWKDAFKAGSARISGLD